MARVSIFLILVALIVGLVGCSPTANQPDGNEEIIVLANVEVVAEVVFPDSNLEGAIREAINKPAGIVYTTDLKNLTILNANKHNIADLTGLEHCINLRCVLLAWNQISDISPLAQLPGVRIDVTSRRSGRVIYSYTTLHISLAGNLITDVTPLGNLTAPDELTLFLSWNQISDISPLSELTNMIALYLCSNNISDLSPLAGMTKLSFLELWGNRIEDISPLSNLTELTWTELSVNNITDISPIAGLTNLRSVQLNNNQITDISPLVENEGLSTGDVIDLQWNPLNENSINIYIPQLQARGVDVSW